LSKSTPFGALEKLRARAIPDQRPMLAKVKGYRRYKLDLADLRAQEPLLDAAARGLAGVNHYATPRNPPYYAIVPGSVPQIRLRQGVIERLLQVNAALAQAGLELFIFDGWRPSAVQKYFHDKWMPRQLLKRNPRLTPAQLRRETERYWAAPTSDPSSPAPHATGGAVDLTIRWRDSGEHLWMGSIFDDASPIARADHFERRAARGFAFSDEEARANRRLLHWLMRKEEFAANPGEWWHFSYGELMWAKLSAAPHAFYGLCER
jgi:D-alanyl-D-alanine dipeptidase